MVWDRNLYRQTKKGKEARQRESQRRKERKNPAPMQHTSEELLAIDYHNQCPMCNHPNYPQRDLVVWQQKKEGFVIGCQYCRQRYRDKHGLVWERGD